MNQLLPIIRRARRPLLPPEESGVVLPVHVDLPPPLPETPSVALPPAKKKAHASRAA